MENEQTTITELESVKFPVIGLRAALSCSSTEETRYYLKGVFLHVCEGDYRAVATDGHRMFIYATPVGRDPVPLWAEKGVIISSEMLKERLALFSKLEGETATIAYQLEAPHVVITGHSGNTTFKVNPVDGEFPDYKRVLPNTAFQARETEDMASTAFDSTYLKGVGDLGKMLGADTIRLFSASADDPQLITFPECPEAVLVLMPKKHETALGAGAARVLSGATQLTLAALKAHRTRNAEKLEKADRGELKLSKGERADLEAKVEGFEQRIQAIIAAAYTPSLPPPPEPTDEEILEMILAVRAELGFEGIDFGGAVIGWLKDKKTVEEAVALYRASWPGYRTLVGLTLDRETGVAGNEAPFDLRAWYGEGVSIEDAVARTLDQLKQETTTIGAKLRGQDVEPTDLGAYRAKLGKGARKKMLARFFADINAVLSERHNGLTIGQLVDSVPIEDWFTAGVSVDEAATRCTDWVPPVEQPADESELEHEDVAQAAE